MRQILELLERDATLTPDTLATMTGLPLDEAPDVDGVKAVHVLFGIHGLEDPRLVDLGRKGELDEDRVDLPVAVQGVDRPEEVVFREIGRKT